MADDWTPPRAPATNLDGKPRGKPGPPKGTRVGGRVPGVPPKTGGPRPPGPSRSKTDYRPGIRGLLQLIAAPFGMLGARTGSMTLIADAAAIHVHTEPLAEGLQQCAEQDPKIAAVLDKILKAGPYAAILAPVIGLSMQIGVNHGWVPIELGAQVGAMAPDDLVDLVAGLPPRPPEPARPAPEPDPVPVPDPVV